MSQPYQPSPVQPPTKKHSPSFWILISLGIAVVAVPLVLFLGCSALVGGAVMGSASESASTFDDSYTDEPVEPEPSASKPKPTYTKSQEQAIGTAKDYLDGDHFSRKGLIRQLKYEGFSTKDATFAADHVRVSWNRQAAGAAEDYLDGQHFSRSGLIRQLKYEGYTQAQAEYGVKKAGL